MDPRALRLYVVSDPELVGRRSVEEVCRLALAAGVGVFQLRDKRASTRALIEQAGRLTAIAEEHGASLVVNDRVDVALAAGAHGVHLGQDDMPLADARRLLGPDLIIGVSVRTPAEAREAELGGATYVAANLVFATATKTDIDVPLGLSGVRALRAACRLPLVAIGGIDADNGAEVIAAGADGLAVVSAVVAAPEPAEACRALLAAVDAGLRGRA